MTHHRDLITRVQKRLPNCAPEVRHDVKNLLMVYEAMSELRGISDLAERRLPALENKLRHFIETGTILKNP